MTTLDRAFIKAFSDSTPARTRTMRPGRKLKAREAARQAMSEPTILPAHPTGLETRLDIPFNPVATSPTAPLASFTADTPRDLLEAQFEVGRLAWPEACDLLLAECGPQWDELIAELVAQQGLGRKCLAVASCRRGEGRTTLVLSLVKRLRHEGLRCLVFDADLDNPVLARRCRVAVSAGWSEILHNERPLSEAMIASIEDGVTLIPGRAGGARPTAAEMSRLADSFCLLREQFDVLLVDTPALADTAATDEFARFVEAAHVDAVYLVRDVRTTTNDELAQVVASLGRMNVAAAGVIENFVAALEPDVETTAAAEDSVVTDEPVGAGAESPAAAVAQTMVAGN